MDFEFADWLGADCTCVKSSVFCALIFRRVEVGLRSSYIHILSVSDDGPIWVVKNRVPVCVVFELIRDIHK